MCVCTLTQMVTGLGVYQFSEMMAMWQFLDLNSRVFMKFIIFLSTYALRFSQKLEINKPSPKSVVVSIFLEIPNLAIFRCEVHRLFTFFLIMFLFKHHYLILSPHDGSCFSILGQNPSIIPLHWFDKGSPIRFL